MNKSGLVGLFMNKSGLVGLFMNKSGLVGLFMNKSGLVGLFMNKSGLVGLFMTSLEIKVDANGTGIGFGLRIVPSMVLFLDGQKQNYDATYGCVLLSITSDNSLPTRFS